MGATEHARQLYDALDRLCFDEMEKATPHHRYSPAGAALHLLHELRQYATSHCVCAEKFEDPPS